MIRPITVGCALAGIAAVLAGRAPQPPPGPDARPALQGMSSVVSGGLPRPDHTVVVVMENHSYSEIIGSPDAPYINSLATAGANFTDSHGVTHPSQPNYLALFAGTIEGLLDDSCPHTFSSPNLASVLTAAGLSFSGYSESMPENGYTGCDAGEYARKHNPWVNYTNVSPAANLTFGAFPADYSLLPTVAFVVPNLCNDMHDCGVATGDSWLRQNIDPYVRWALTHNSLFILTFDEDATDTLTNQIPTIFVGPMVLTGDKAILITHFSVLRLLEDLYSVPLTGAAALVPPIVGVFATPTPNPVPRMPIFPLPAPTRGPTVVPFRAAQ